MTLIKKILICALFAFTSVATYSQDDELDKLTQIVNSLKSGGEKAYRNAITSLSTDKQWTPMDELGIDKNAECKASERTPGFRLNSALTNAENAERYQTTTANHLNGADSRYAYSLYEKTIRAGKSVAYTLPERWGDQTFIIIPYSGQLSVSISSADNSFTSSSLDKGALKFTGKAVKGSPVKLNISNNGSANVSYVIINYNSRK